MWEHGRTIPLADFIDRTSGAQMKTAELQMNIRAKLIDICDAFNAHDLDRIMTFFADDCVLEMPKGSKPFGHNVREGLAARFAGLPDVHYGNAWAFCGFGISNRHFEMVPHRHRKS